MQANSLLGATLRANPAYQLVPFDRLSPAEQSKLQDLTRDPGFYGLLRPREAAGLGQKSVCCETARLCLTLATPGPIPHYLQRLHDESLNQNIADLVIDGVLELGTEDGFVSGAAAYEHIYGPAPALAARGALARLSLEALAYGQRLDIQHAGQLSARLYFYHRLPLTPAWKRTLPDGEAIWNFLGLGRGSAAARLVEQSWRGPEPGRAPSGWYVWERRDTAVEAASGPTYKLYVSPAMTALAGAFATTMDVLAGSEARHVKVGAQASGLLRPDKLIAYFDGREALMEAAGLLATKLAGCPVHGVPFTAELAEGGLLSWGVDPPREPGASGWREQESWRLWLTNRLALALLAARRCPGRTIEPWRFALERVQREGVDTDSWTPVTLSWCAAAPGPPAALDAPAAADAADPAERSL